VEELVRYLSPSPGKTVAATVEALVRCPPTPLAKTVTAHEQEASVLIANLPTDDATPYSRTQVQKQQLRSDEQRMLSRCNIAKVHADRETVSKSN
jgi:hypothetical protein